MDLLLLVLGLSVVGLWILWWMTYRALRHAESVAAERQARIETHLAVIEQLVERQGAQADGMLHLETRRDARREVQRLLDRQ